MQTIVEKIIEARKKFPAKFDYASKVVNALADDGVTVSKQNVYKIGSGFKKESNFNEVDVLIAQKIIELGNTHQTLKNSLLTENIDVATVSPSKAKKYAVHSEETLTV
jgi:hypothetical protein